MELTRSFHNTTKIKGKELQSKEASCKSQEENLISLIKRHGGQPLSASQAHERYEAMYGRIKESSIRRALTNLKNRRKLVKLDAMVVSPYGSAEHLYALS